MSGTNAKIESMLVIYFGKQSLTLELVMWRWREGAPEPLNGLAYTYYYEFTFVEGKYDGNA